MRLWPSLWVICGCCCIGTVLSEDEQTCSITTSHPERLERRLHEMHYDVGDGWQTTQVYVEPNIQTFYQDRKAPAKTKVVPKFNGLSGKFINMSNKPVSFYWEDTKGGTKHPMRHMLPFSVTGTATFPTHRFLMTEEDQPDKILQSFVVEPYPGNVYYYDPYHVEGDPEQTELNLQQHLEPDERKLYDAWRKTIRFHEQYRNATGRSYLANYLRKPPMHFMWPADYFNQTHWVVTRESHFTSLPPDLGPIVATPAERRALSGGRLLPEYRDAQPLNLTLRVLSVAPRVFDIPNFLSETEMAHILDIAGGVDLKLSQTGEYQKGEKKIKETTKTRTSFNSWVARERSPILDAIYRRAADVMRMDEALLRHRDADEWPDLPSKSSLAEQLQLVHYDVAQEYTAHHDFGYSRIDDEVQDERFATLLLYLNEGMKGGETSFPRYANAETFQPLKVEPRAGRAVLFYSQLPDGNMDDFSEHAALPVKEGEKWLINLWVHDPLYAK